MKADDALSLAAIFGSIAVVFVLLVLPTERQRRADDREQAADVAAAEQCIKTYVPQTTEVEKLHALVACGDKYPGVVSMARIARQMTWAQEENARELAVLQQMLDKARR